MRSLIIGLVLATEVGAGPLPPAAVAVFSIRPSQTTAPGEDPIGAANGNAADRCTPDERPDRGHWLYAPLAHGDDPAVTLVFLAGHGERPESYPDFVQAARENGYRVIALDYPNAIKQSLTQVCDGSDGSCYWKHRYEIAYGVEKGSAASHISTCPEESIVNRLRRLLIYLRQNHYPGWDAFTAWDAAKQSYRVDWSQVAIAGHSGFAALLAKHEKLHRVILLAEPADAWGSPARPADWIDGHDTDASRYYGLDHHDDQTYGVDIVGHVEMSWTRLGLPGPLQVYHPSTAIPAGTHRLESAEPVPSGVEPHFDIARNGSTYAKAWKYMLGKAD